MHTETSLWVRSTVWRWTLVLTCLATGVVALLAWNKPAAPIATTQANYQRPRSFGINLRLRDPLVKPASGFYDQIFDAPITDAAPANLPAGTELHVIGVFQGALPAGQLEQPRSANCGVVGDYRGVSTCFQPAVKSISMTVSRSTVPIMLALMAHEPVKWKLVGASGANIQGIILAGHHGQDIEGMLETTPVDVYTHEPSPCQKCSRHGDSFSASKEGTPEYIKALDKLKTITGLSPTSFQGAHRANQFYIAPKPVPGAGSPSTNANIPSAPIIGNDFEDHITVAGMDIPLSEGHWRGIVDINNLTSRGNDEMVVLARTEKNRLLELIAVRAQFAVDNKGFPRYLACEAKGMLTQKVERNEDSGMQLCYWVNHVTEPWVQPIFALAEKRLALLGIAAPKLLINTGIHKADKHSALTALYLSNPDAKGITSPSTNWAASPWHPDHIKEFPDKQLYVQERTQWSDIWFQIFKASQGQTAQE